MSPERPPRAKLARKHCGSRFGARVFWTRSPIALARFSRNADRSFANMPDRALTIAIDPELQPGARNAIRVCLRLKPEERITIITDEVSREIAAALQKEVEEVGAEHAVFVLEEYAERPLTDMPEIVLEDLAQSQVSIFCAQSQRGELRSRMQMSAS